MKTVKTSKELGEAIKSNEDYIYVEGDLKNKVIRIKATGKIAWASAAGSLAAAITLYLTLPATLATSTVAGGPVGTAVGGAISFTGGAITTTIVATALGVKAAAVAIAIGVACGGIGGVITLRDKYIIVNKGEDGIILKRKK